MTPSLLVLLVALCGLATLAFVAADEDNSDKEDTMMVLKDLVISEVADPAVDDDLRYLTIANLGQDITDFQGVPGHTGLFIYRFTNGVVKSKQSLQNVKIDTDTPLTIPHGGTFVICKNKEKFDNTYGSSKACDQEETSNNFLSNGDDDYLLASGSLLVGDYPLDNLDPDNHDTLLAIDMYRGSLVNFDFENKMAIRKADTCVPAFFDSEFVVRSTTSGASPTLNYAKVRVARREPERAILNTCATPTLRTPSPPSLTPQRHNPPPVSLFRPSAPTVRDQVRPHRLVRRSHVLDLMQRSRLLVLWRQDKDQEPMRGWRHDFPQRSDFEPSHPCGLLQFARSA